jgi:putative sigma-54 modulation protein
MKIIFQTPDFKATKKLERFVHRHLEKLSITNGQIIEGRICLKLDKSDTDESKVCEIKLAIPGNDLFATKQTRAFEESVKTVNALKHQLEHLKTSREKLKHSED